MQRHFDYAHTIEPQPVKDSDDDMQGLFMIGGKKIQIDVKNKKEVESDSDQTVKGKPIKKNKKQKKDKKQKKQKKQHQHKDKKDKHKKKKQQGSDQSDQQSEKYQKKQDKYRKQSNQQRQLDIYKDKQKQSLVQKYKSVLYKKSLQQIYRSDFELNYNLGEGLLTIDIIKYPQRRLYEYELMDKQVPRYRRDPSQHIIGLNDHKQQQRIIRQLNKKINQKNINPNQQLISQNRYFDYTGYDQVGLQQLVKQTNLPVSLIKFNIDTSTMSPEQVLTNMSRQYNRRLNQQPHNIQLWLDFLKNQEFLALGNNKHPQALLQRKLSIIQKSLTLNPFNQHLGVQYLSLLFLKQSDRSLILSKCTQLIKKTPSSIPLWRLYFSLQVQSLSTFSHPFLRNLLQQTTQLFKQVIGGTQSAIQIWKIRKACLEVLKNMLLVYKMEGYHELATGLIVGMIDFNICMPEKVAAMVKLQDKLKEFQKYWDDANVFKLGQSNYGSTWNTPHKIIDRHPSSSYIGDIDPKLNSRHKNPLQKQMQSMQSCWRPANPMLQKPYIQSNPQSYILFQDISFGIMLYRDPQSYKKLIDILLDHLQLPTMFSPVNIYSQFSYKCVQKQYMNIVKKKKFSRSKVVSDFYYWHKYWDPTKTCQVLNQYQIIKIQYCRRILIAIRPYLANLQSNIDEYLTFLTCCIYVCPQVQQKLDFSSQQASGLICELIARQPLSIPIWTMYIQSTFSIKNNTNECIQCFRDLFSNIHAQIADRQKRLQNKYQVLFWMQCFSKHNKIDITSSVLKAFMELSQNPQMAQISLQQQLSPLDQLRLNSLMASSIQQQINQYQSVTQDSSLIYKIKNILFAITCSLSSQQLVNLDLISVLLKIVLQSSSFHSDFALWLLISYRMLKIQHINQQQLLKQTPTIQIARYYSALSPCPLLMFQSHFFEFPYKSIALWLAAGLYRWQGDHHLNLLPFICSFSIKVHQNQKISSQEWRYIVLLNQLKLYDDTKQHKGFLVYSLRDLPFSKALYLINMRDCDRMQGQRMGLMMQQKGIRVLNQQLIN